MSFLFKQKARADAVTSLHHSLLKLNTGGRKKVAV